MNQDNIIGGGTNDRPKADTIAETGPGLPDEAVGPGETTEAEKADRARSGDQAGQTGPTSQDDG